MTSRSTAAPTPTAPAPVDTVQAEEPSVFARILVALDASPHADRALAEAVRLAATAGGTITGIHAYAALLHDRRFRQMEGGLPERYHKEEEMEHQRDVHDDLITQGLEIISDSYHDAAARVCEQAGRPFKRLSPEGKNYRRIVEAAGSGDFDVLALGAVGLGTFPGSLVGTVCERVVRRSPIDTLVIRDTERAIGDGPIVVALDGSARAFGALRTALNMGAALGAEVHVVAAYDPYYHYVAFNKISKVLSEEAGKVFRFKEQEALHEELIDDGIAKIYQSHLEVAREVAEAEGAEIKIALLDGKPYKAILDYLAKTNASLLLVGKTGAHADDGLDIGGNAENLLRHAPCHIWIGVATYEPPMDVVAEESISWSEEAEARLARAPDFVQGMARKAVIRHAIKSGHTFITSDMVAEVAGLMMPGGVGKSGGGRAEIPWSGQAAARIEVVTDLTLAQDIRLKAEKHARRNGVEEVRPEDVIPFLPEDAGEPESVDVTSGDMRWASAALARLARVPDGFMRRAARDRVESVAREDGVGEITLEVVEKGLARARQAMEGAMSGASPKAETKTDHGAPENWNDEAWTRLNYIPAGLCRNLTRKFAEDQAAGDGITRIDRDYFDLVLEGFRARSAEIRPALVWDGDADMSLEQVPEKVRGVYIGEVESFALDRGHDRVNLAVLGEFQGRWDSDDVFTSLIWTDEAEAMMLRVPDGFMRDLTRQRVEAFAHRTGATRVSKSLIEEKYAEWSAGSAGQRQEMEWRKEALDSIERIPDFVRPMVMKEVERHAREHGHDKVTLDVLKQSRGKWADSGVFHSPPQVELE